MPADGLLDIDLAYGRQGLRISLPADRTTVVAPAYHRGRAGRPGRRCGTRCAQPVAGPPLRAVVRPGAAGRDLGLRRHPAAAAAPDDPGDARRADGASSTLDDVIVLVATGTHRGNTDAELRAMLGAEVAARLRVVNHDARDDEHADLVRGRTATACRSG